MNFRSEDADPNGPECTALLNLAAQEVARIYGRPDPERMPMRDPPLSAGQVRLLVREAGEAVAMAGLHPLQDGVLELRRMFVRADWRGRGVAQALLDALMRRAQELGAAQIWLETGDRQLAAHRLYRRYGFDPIAPFGPHAADPTSLFLGIKVPSPARR